MPNLERARAPLPLPHLFLTLFFDAVFLARPKLRDLRTETKCRKLMLGAFCEIPHSNKELMKESHTKDKGDIGLDREELARGGTSL